jgi:hypothetical protein
MTKTAKSPCKQIIKHATRKREDDRYVRCAENTATEQICRYSAALFALLQRLDRPQMLLKTQKVCPVTSFRT